MGEGLIVDPNHLAVSLDDLQTLSPAEAVVLAYIRALAGWASQNPRQWLRFFDVDADRALGLSKVGNVLRRLEKKGRLESRWLNGRKSREVRFLRSSRRDGE